MRVRSLNGKWKYAIGKRDMGEINVPYSALCVGKSSVERTFDSGCESEAVLLRFERIK